MSTRKKPETVDNFSAPRSTKNLRASSLSGYFVAFSILRHGPESLGFFKYQALRGYAGGDLHKVLHKPEEGVRLGAAVSTIRGKC
jgi:hypothetical protein